MWVKKLRRVNFKLRDKTPCVVIIVEFAEFETNRWVDSLLVNDQVKIPVVNKTNANSVKSIKKDRHKNY